MKTIKTNAWLLFLLGFIGFMFTRLSNHIPFISIAILIAPVFILRFIRTQPKKRGIWLTLLGFTLSMNIALWGLFKFDEPHLTIIFGIIRSTLLAIIWFLPFMVDRLIYPFFKGKGFLSTLTFPIIVTAIFYLMTLDGPFDDGAGTLSSFGFTYGSLAFTQIRSVFGVWILVFIHSWLFSTVNFIWDQNIYWHKIKYSVIAYTSVIVSIFVFGFLKINRPYNTEKVKIASIVLLPDDGNAVLMSKYFESGSTTPFNETLIKVNKLTRMVAEQGAKIVSFQEFTMLINEADQDTLRSRLKHIAKENGIFLSVAYAYYGQKEKGENIHLLIDDAGEIRLDYAKRYLFGIGSVGEAGVFKKGPEIIQSTHTPYGIIGVSICRDMSFPSFIRQAGKSGVDIMLSPSYDWPRSYSPWYITNTIENGFSLVRPSYNGYSYAADYNGKVINHMNFSETKNGIMYANVPVKGVKTLYSDIGDVLGWLNLILLFGMVIYTLRKKTILH